MTRFAPLWQQAGSYSASVDRALMGALWPTGGAVGGVVTAVASTMQVQIAPGTVAVPLQAGQSTALCRWDANEFVTLTAAPSSGQSRIDVIIAQVRDNALDAGANNDFIFSAVTGTPATTGSQVAPAVPTNAAAVAQVTVPGAVANLSTATFTDRRLNPLSPWTVSDFRIRHTASQAQANGVNNWAGQIVDEDTDAGYSTGDGFYTIKRAGLWIFSGSVSWSGNATGVRACGIFCATNAQFPGTNWGSFDSAGAGDPSLAGRTTVALGPVRLVIGDRVNFQIYQSSGGALNSGVSHFSGQWTGP
jgi:hypothetical protein